MKERKQIPMISSWIKSYTIIITTLLIWLSLTSTSKSEVLYTIDTPGHSPARIAPDIIPGNYWVLDGGGYGLIYLQENPDSTWTSSEYPIDYVSDLAYLSDHSQLFLTYYSIYEGSGVHIFNCLNQQISSTIELGSDYVVTGLALSSDETLLYVLGWDWPRLGNYYSLGASISHPDTGIIWVVDLTTLEVERYDGIVGSNPETIICTESASGFDKLIVFTGQVKHYFMYGDASQTYIIRTDRGLQREAVIDTPYAWETPYISDLIDWSDTEPLVAICCLVEDWDYENFKKGLWILNTETGQIVDRLSILDPSGHFRPVIHAYISQINPCNIYISAWTGQNGWGILVIDYDTGSLISTIDTGPDFEPNFIYETPEGLLIVTGGESGKILIIDPEL
jgi:hypothetical protein